MAEVEFEDNSTEIKEYLQTVRECKQHITQIPAVLKKLLDMLNTSTALLEDLCTFDDAPDSLQRQCVRSRQQMISFYEGSALKSLTDSIQGVVHQRLMRMEQIALQSYTACKRRREARAKYLSDTNAKLPFNLAAPSPEKLQRHKEEYTERDDAYRRACEEFAQYRYEEMGTAQRDFYSGYSGVFALLTNALILPEVDVSGGGGGGDASVASTTTRGRMRREPRRQGSSSLRARNRQPAAAAAPSSSTPSGGGAEAGEEGRDATRRRNSAPACPPSTATEAQNSQRRLSDGGSAEKPPVVAVAAAAAGDETWRRTDSMRSGEVVPGIPVEGSGGKGYGGGSYEYTSSPKRADARVQESQAPLQTTTTSVDNSDGSRSSSEGGEDASDHTRRSVVRKSSNTTLNHFNRVSPDAESFRHEYSMFGSFDAD